MIVGALLFVGCSKSTLSSQEIQEIDVAHRDGFKIAFGSCNHQNRSQAMWAEIVQEQPDLWVWLGDNVYADTDDPVVMKQKYDKQHSHPEYQQFVSSVRVNGVWDDHDYGLNDGGKEYTMKAASQQLFLDFIQASDTDVRRTREGTYGMTEMRMEDLKVSLFYLDTRYFRDALVGPKGDYGQNLDGTILGDEQWTWLANKLQASDADVHIIVSSIQVVAAEHGFEKWANFPKERERLFDLIVDSKIENPVILSGDRHLAEISKINWRGINIYDVTSSSLTSPIRTPREEPNQFRVDAPNCEIIFDKNYGVLSITREGDGVALDAYIKSDYDTDRLHVRLVK